MRLPKRSALGLFAVLAHVHLAVPMAAAGEPAATNDPPAAGGECSFSCVPGTSGCPLTVPGPRCDYITELVKGNLANAVADKSSGRSVPNAALCQLLVGCPQPPGCCAPSTVACVQPPPPPVCEAALALLQRSGGRPGTSFGGQVYPLVWHAFAGSCFNATAKAWLFGLINASLPMSIAESTPQEYSYTNMWLMSTVNSILFGEIVGGERGRIAADVGYRMWAEFYNYTMRAGLDGYNHTFKLRLIVLHDVRHRIFVRLRASVHPDPPAAWTRGRRSLSVSSAHCDCVILGSDDVY